VQITFDPTEITYGELLKVFFTIHDPTTRDRQGPDIGTQYRSAIFYESAEQKSTADRVMRDFESTGVWDGPIVTQLAPLEAFYPAERYHQRYYERNTDQPYCRAIIAPKVAKARAAFLARLKRRDGEAIAEGRGSPGPSS
jgi:peptide-methionine (S)-S-oxide reductase